MKKLLFSLFSIIFIVWPISALAFDSTNLSVPKVNVSFAELQEKKEMDIPVKFTLTASASELSEIKMVKLSVENTCPGQSGFNVMGGSFQPAANDYSDGKIEGTLIYDAYWTDAYHSCQGKHDVKLYFCRAVDPKCTWASDTTVKIAMIELPEVININGDTPPGDEPPPGPDEPPIDNGGGYNPLLPSGRFGSIWEVLVRIVQALLALAAVVATAALIIGGYQYMTSQGNPDKAQVAKTTITYAIIGLLLVMTFYVIMRYALPALGVSRDVIWF